MTPFELYGQNGVLEKDDLGPCGEVEISFRLPVDPDYLTDIAKLPPRYWELEVNGEVEGEDFLGLFLVPVYLPTTGEIQAQMPDKRPIAHTTNGPVTSKVTPSDELPLAPR